ncbi:MAG: lipopolysaccharide core heptose(I) kinase RfaP [Desulfobacterales bacterium]|nr:lipopolysaccharide core heptose(I) kinase RfaP [Desulfobacterales bacterium]
MIVLPDVWMEYWRGKDIFKGLFSLDGSVYREQEGRKTLRFSFRDRYYFAKLHRGVGWKEILKNILQFRLPVFSAQNEWRAISSLEKLGVNTTPLVGYGQRGWNPARIKSFVITEEIANTKSLEDFCRDWPNSPPDHDLKRVLITQVAEIARTVHENGLNHRDFYICHFLLDMSVFKDRFDPRCLRLYLIDLHRMQIRRCTPWRCRVKDIAALYFSSMDIGLTKCDLLRFIKVYQNKPLKSSFGQHKFFWWLVKRRGIALKRKFYRKNK